MFRNTLQLEDLINGFENFKDNFKQNLTSVDFHGTEQFGDILNKLYSEK